MQQLIDQFIENGLTNEQAIRSLQTISSWLDENYPVAGALTNAWINKESENS